MPSNLKVDSSSALILQFSIMVTLRSSSKTAISMTYSLNICDPIFGMPCLTTTVNSEGDSSLIAGSSEFIPSYLTQESAHYIKSTLTSFIWQAS